MHSALAVPPSRACLAITALRVPSPLLPLNRPPPRQNVEGCRAADACLPRSRVRPHHPARLRSYRASSNRPPSAISRPLTLCLLPRIHLHLIHLLPRVVGGKAGMVVVEETQADTDTDMGAHAGTHTRRRQAGIRVLATVIMYRIIRPVRLASSYRPFRSSPPPPRSPPLPNFNTKLTRTPGTPSLTSTSTSNEKKRWSLPSIGGMGMGGTKGWTSDSGEDVC
jgi:hypothetical protein